MLPKNKEHFKVHFGIRKFKIYLDSKLRLLTAFNAGILIFNSKNPKFS